MNSATISHGYRATGAHVLGRAFRASFVPDVRPIVFLLDEDASFRESLERLIRREGWRPESFASPEEFLACPHAAVPNSLVIGTSLLDPRVLELQKRVTNERPGTSIIFIADRIDLATTVRAVKAGAFEFFTKPFRDDVLSTAIREALESSRCALSQEAGLRLLRNSYGSLSPRERQVMVLLVSGLLNKQVGGELNISEHTVKVHRGRIMQKMQADSFAQLVRMAARLGVPLYRTPESEELGDATFV
jgi:FixJ family two-component response regulator